MKVDFIKEVKPNGDIFYYTTIDGAYVDSSLSKDSIEAIETYEKILEGKNRPEITIIRTTIIGGTDDYKQTITGNAD